MEEECEECEEGAPAWMATFSDMATLLLTFFVLLLSFANMDIQNFKSALGSVREAFGVQTKTRGDHEALASSLMEWSEDPPSAMLNNQDSAASTEVQKLREYIERRGMQHQIEVMGTQSGIVLRVKDVALFDTGSDNLRKDSEPVLQLVEELFKKSRAVLSIEGHTDNVPIAKARFPSNWELSAARSAAVLRHYVARGLTKGRLSIAGYGDLRPIATNKTQEGRKRNRRVEFVFKREPGYNGQLFQLEDKESEDSAESKAATDSDSNAPVDNQAKDNDVESASKARTGSSADPSDRGKTAPDDRTNEEELNELQTETVVDENGWMVPRDSLPAPSPIPTLDDGSNIRDEARDVPQEDFQWNE